ncbi:hypothetical protein P7C70_g3485, partial [Phenoliferia sp. Uapishka_3]
MQQHGAEVAAGLVVVGGKSRLNDSLHRARLANSTSDGRCDETWSNPQHVGVCTRCFTGSFECDRTPPPRQLAKPRTARPSPYTLPQPGPSSSHQPSSTLAPHFASTSSVASTSSLAPYHFPELEAQPFLANFFESLDQIQLNTPQDSSPYDATSAAETLLGVLTKATTSEKSATGTQSPAAQDATLSGPSPDYNSFNEGFLMSIPNPLRKILTKRVDDVAASHELTRTSSLAICLLYRARSLPNSDEARAKLIEQSDEHYQAALRHLDAAVPLEAQMIAVLDLQYLQFDRFGSAAAQSIILLGSLFCTSSGVEVLDFTTLVDPPMFPLRCFAYTEILSHVCSRRRTIFKIANLPDEDTGRSGERPPPSGDPRLETHLGLPVGLLLCFAATSNLSLEMDTLDPTAVEVRTRRIESAIREWQPRRTPGGALEGSDSISHLEELRIFEIWRHAALLHLFQSVQKLGPHNTLIRFSLSQILMLVERKTSSSSLDLNAAYSGSPLAAPLLLAAMIATHSDDRESLRQELVACGPQMAYRQNVEAVEHVWAVVDNGGWTVDWRDVLEKEGLAVAFL